MPRWTNRPIRTHVLRYPPPFTRVTRSSTRTIFTCQNPSSQAVFAFEYQNILEAFRRQLMSGCDPGDSRPDDDDLNPFHTCPVEEVEPICCVDGGNGNTFSNRQRPALCCNSQQRTRGQLAVSTDYSSIEQYARWYAPFTTARRPLNARCCSTAALT